MVMLLLYRLIFVPALLVMAPAYLRRMIKRGGYRGAFRQRFGGHPVLPPRKPGVRRVWLQAVSVGEMLAIGPLLEALRRDGHEVYLTTTTSTGFRLGNDRYHGLMMGIGYFPIDWWPFSVRAWRRIDPDLVILTEGERWPEHMRQATLRAVPVLCINARLSDRSFRRMRWFRPAAHLMLDGITRLLAGSSLDESRFRELGMPAEKLLTTGNIKLDVQIPLLSERERTQLRRDLGLPPGLVLLGSSTWPGEVEVLLEALANARARDVRCALLVVPRHAERRHEIEHLLQKSGLSYHLRSRGVAPHEVEVVVGDTTGELRRLTQVADLVFVGKSLAPHTEGQTPVEAAVLGKPIVFGPGMGSFRVIAAELVATGAARQVANARQLKQVVPDLLTDAAQRAALAAAAVAWHRQNAGAMGRTLAVIREEMEKLK